MLDVRKLRVGDKVRLFSGVVATVKTVRINPNNVTINFVEAGVRGWFYNFDGSADGVAEDEHIVEILGGEEDLTGVEATLEERGKRYGSFEDNGFIAQSLKDVLTKGKEWDSMPLHHREALHMICSKMSRIVTADYMYDDNYKDIIGYATLVLKEIEDE